MDAHAHFRACFEWDRFFDAAAANFRRLKGQLGQPGESARCLWLTEGPSDRSFPALAARAETEPECGWRLQSTAEEGSLWAVGPAGDRIVLIAGRQLETRERLEVLALGTTMSIPGDLPFGEALAAVNEAGAVAVVPWGFGKWWFGRRRVLMRHLEGSVSVPFFLGDIATRPRWPKRSPLFAIARSRGIPILPGSDPPPYPDGVNRIASHGFALRADWNPTRPSEDFKKALRELQSQPPTLGDRMTPVSFLENQVRLSLRSLFD